MWRRVPESNLGHSRGRWALSPLRYPCSPSPTHEISREQAKFTRRKPLFKYKHWTLQLHLLPWILLQQRDISHSLKFYLDRVLEFRMHNFIVKNCLLWAFRINFDASTPSESAVTPKSNFIEFGSADEWSSIWTMLEKPEVKLQSLTEDREMTFGSSWFEKSGFHCNTTLEIPGG